MTQDLDQRRGLPAELKTLLARYPRDTWRSAGSQMAHFWLDRHAEFRHHAAALQTVANECRSERKSIEEFVVWTAPRLQAFIGALHGHHQIEDFHYFPVFREMHEALAPGFDVLARDHELLHAGIIESVDAFNALLALVRGTEESNTDARKHAAEQYLDVGDVMFRRLMRHLDDEEDLIIPIMLDQDERPPQSA